MRKLFFISLLCGLFFSACGDSPSSEGLEPPIVPNGGGSNVTPEPDAPSGEVQQITIADFLAKADQQTTYRLEGTVRNIINTQYGNFDLEDETGSIYIYGLLDKAGQPKNFASLNVKAGDRLTLEGVYTLYNDKPEIKNAQYISHVPGLASDEEVFTGSKDYLRRVEVPLLKPGSLFIEHSVAYEQDSVMNYCLEYDTQALHSRWVAFRFDAVTRVSNVSRSDEPFTDDPDVPSDARIGRSTFGNQYYDLEGNLLTLPAKNFDRGHLCASSDRYMSKEANEQTFYMTNMSPQMNNFNSPYWSSFESYVRARGRDASFADTLFVVKGGTIADGQILGYVKRPNGTQVVIPKYYFMALLSCKADKYSALAFWMEHKDYGEVDQNYKQMSECAVSIDQLEELTGIDFFHNLPDDIEEKVESELKLSDWSFNQ